jgi:hypothetical protein
VAVLTDKACFLHIPKTGGRFVRAALSAADIEWREVGEVEPHKLVGGRGLFEFGHTGEPSRRMHAIPEMGELGDVQAFTFVRHPVSWLRSFFCHDGGRAGGGYLDNRRVRHNHFNDFALDVARKDPGIVGELFSAYAVPGVAVWHLSTIGLVDALIDAGHEFDPAVIEEMEPVGASEIKPAVGPGVFAAVCDAEAPIIEEFGFTAVYEQWARVWADG